MSVSYNVFVGPYIKVRDIEIDRIEEYHTCLSTGCRNHKKEMSCGFCPKCGGRIERISRVVKGKIDFDYYDELGGNFNEVFEYEKRDFKIFTSDIGNDIGFDGDFKEIPIGNITPATEITNLYEKYNKEVARIKEVFGDENVQVLWGVVTWVS